ncbi:hypothetical protein MKX03_004402 [Papaver bracteatum]|nr:hypothetical protein MKX03_004402 [Papaver bracteatum]
MTLKSKEKIPTKQEWLSFWYRDGRPNWIMPTKDEKRVVYTINVHGFYIEFTTGGYGVILRDNFGRPSSGIDEPVCLHFHELQGVKRGLQHVLDYKLVSYYIEIHFQSEITDEVLRLIRKEANYIVNPTDRSHISWENMERCFDGYEGELFEVFRPLIQEIS